MAKYYVAYADGSPDVDVDTYDDAVSLLSAKWPDAEIGHDGDISDRGDRTLCWPDEASSQNDDGKNAVASILVYHADDDVD